jgi:hypothetical protein
MRLLSALLFLSLFATACSKPASKEDIPPPGMAGTHPGSINIDHTMETPDQRALSDAQKNRRVLKGKVVEAIYKEGFAYVRLEMGAEASTWVAIVNQKPAVGESISVQEQAVLTDFHSKSLDRTFTKIIFGSIVD